MTEQTDMHLASGSANPGGSWRVYACVCVRFVPGSGAPPVPQRAASHRLGVNSSNRARPLQAAAAATMQHDGAEGQAGGLEAMQRAAAKRGRDYEKSAARAAPAPGSAAFQDYSRRAFYKEFVKVGAGGPAARAEGRTRRRRAAPPLPCKQPPGCAALAIH